MEIWWKVKVLDGAEVEDWFQGGVGNSKRGSRRIGPDPARLHVHVSTHQKPPPLQMQLFTIRGTVQPPVMHSATVLSQPSAGSLGL